MTDQRPFEDEQMQRLLTAAAELPGSPATPGDEFTARARRGLIRRRLAAAAAVSAAVLATAVTVPAMITGRSGRDGLSPAATTQCLQTAAQELRVGQQHGFQVVYGQVRTGSIAIDDGITTGSTFRFEIDGTLTGSGKVLSPGPVLVWFPVSEAQLPRPGHHVLLLKQADRPTTNGRLLYDFTPETVLPLDTDGRIQLKCGNGTTSSTDLEQLRAALTSR